jgi:hypothetical protein
MGTKKAVKPDNSIQADTIRDNIIKNEENIHISCLCDDKTRFNKGIVITENIIACNINNNHVIICCHGNGGENPFILKLL